MTDRQILCQSCNDACKTEIPSCVSEEFEQVVNPSPSTGTNDMCVPIVSKFNLNSKVTFLSAFCAGSYEDGIKND